MRTATQAILTFLLNSVWQVAVILAFAAICDWLLRGLAPRYRHGLWIVALILSALLPAWSSIRATHSRSFARQDQFVAPVSPNPTVTSRIITPGVEEAGPTVADGAPPQPTKSVSSNAFPSTIHVSRSVAIALASVYVLFVFGGFLRLFRSWRRTLSILKDSYECELTTTVRSVVDKCERVFGLKCTRVRVSTHVPLPITLGLLRPTIILPESLMREADKELLMSAIGHEMVHVSRRDYLWNLVFELIYVPLSFHPATALIRRRIRQTRELCCDEVVATKLLRPETYARSLMRLIGSAPLSPPLLSDTTIGLNQSDILEVRIMSLLKSRNSRRRRLSLLAAALVLLAPCVVVAKLALRLEVAAQEPVVNSREQEKQQKQSDEKSLVRELRLAARQLEERLQNTRGPQRAEIEQRLREVQKNLEEHERAASNLREHLEKYRASIQEFDERRSKDMAELEKASEKFAQIITEYPRDEAAMREARMKFAELEKLSQTNRKAKLIYRVEPDYSPDAREKKIEGTVLLGVTVGHDGLPQNIQIKKSLYPSLDEKAVEAVRKWRFEPALKDGQPVSMYLLIEINFSLYGKQKEAIEKQEWPEYGTAEYGSDLKAVRRKKELEGQAQDERARRQAELAQGAVISMDRAIQIATSKYPGKVIACSLGRDKEGPVFYHLVMLATDGDKTVNRYIWISAIDGTILKTEDEKRAAAISGGTLNGKATSLPNPEYPEIARMALASGTVTVQVTIDEQGNVSSANAVSGHPLLQAAAVHAARNAKFTPTLLEGQPVKVRGVLTYNFVVQ